MNERKNKRAELDPESLRILEYIDKRLMQEYDAPAVKETAASDPISQDAKKQRESGSKQIDAFSSDYERRKKFILEGRAGEVARELKQKRTRQSFRRKGKKAAAVILLLGCLCFAIGPRNVQAVILRFGRAVVSVFTTHTEYAYTDSDSKDTLHLAGKVRLETYLPESYEIDVSKENEYGSYHRAAGRKDRWIALKTVDLLKANDLKLQIDSEEAAEAELVLEGITVKQYVKENLINYYWEYANQVFVLTGNSEPDLRDVLEKLILGTVKK